MSAAELAGACAGACTGEGIGEGIGEGVGEGVGEGEEALGGPGNALGEVLKKTSKI